MSHDYLMNIASILYFICYVPEFYANYANKNANVNNVIEKVVMLIATTFALSYSLKINNQALIINYGPVFALDIVALSMRSYYAYKNRNIDVKVIENDSLSIHNPIHDVENPLHDVENPVHEIENNIYNIENDLD
jgi:hypothetical protein